MPTPLVFDGTRLQAARLAADLTRTQLAAGIHRTERCVTGYELGQITPPADIVGALAGFLDVSPADFFTSTAGVAA